MKRQMLFTLIVLGILAAACSTGTPKALGQWVDQTYEPAMLAIHDPELSVWKQESVSADEIAASCGVALDRHDEWDERLRQAPDKTLKAKVADYIDAERVALTECMATGERPTPSHELTPVVEQLKRMGIRFSED